MKLFLKGKTKLIGAYGTRLLREYVSKEDPTGAKHRGGFPDRPRKASAWRGNQHFNSINTQKCAVGKINYYRVCSQMEL
jgi:hypothetical protein